MFTTDSFRNRRKMRKKAEEEKRRAAEEDLRRRLRLMKEYFTVHLIESERLSPALQTGDETAGLRALCASIRRDGLLEPLAVRRISEDESPMGGLFTILDGRKRYLALKSLGIHKIPCVIVDVRLEDAAEAAAAQKITAARDDLFTHADLLREIRECPTFREERFRERLALGEEEYAALEAAARLPDEERAIARSCFMPDEMLREIVRIADPERRKQTLFGAASTLISLQKSLIRERKGGRRLLFNDLTPLCNSVDRLVLSMRSAGIPAVWSKSASESEFELKIVVPRRTYRIVTDHSDDQLECIRTGTQKAQNKSS